MFKDWPIILVSPKGPLNVGGIARAMGNFGLRQLRLVDPRCDLKGVECKQMALQSYELIEKAEIFSSLQEAIADLTMPICLSGRLPDQLRPSCHLYEIEEKIHPHISADEKVGIIFGREEMGLLLEELCLCRWQIEIPTNPEKPSINLTSAVAIGLSWMSQVFDSPVSRDFPDYQRPPQEKSQIFFDRIHELLHEVKFLNKENPMMLRDDFWALYHRADLSDRELRILFGMLSAVEGALRIKSSKSES